MSDGGKLAARTTRLDADPDLLAVAGSDGVLFCRGRTGLAGRGTAIVVPVARDEPARAARSVHEALDLLVVDDEVQRPGCGPVGFAALPFAPAAPGRLVVPATVVGADEDGTRWVTTVLPADATEADHDAAAGAALDGAVGPPPPRASGFRVEPQRTGDDWCRAVAAARDELRRGAARKVVLAHELRVTADEPFDQRLVLERLRQGYPACMLFAVEGFVGASPELLVARSGDIVRSHPMAGTAPRSADPTTDARLAAALLASTKDGVEHRITIDMVHDTLLPWVSYLDEEAEPAVVAMANVQHLATRLEGRLSAPPASVIELVTALHPTPAVGGSPRPEALALIDRHELADRGRYAGPVGWVDHRGNGAWAVGIRSAELDGHAARVFAGVGVVPDSDVDAELAETQAKFQAVLSALLRP